MPAPKINSVAEVVVAAPLLALVAAACRPRGHIQRTRVSRPLYSSTRTSGYAAAWLKVTVTVLLPAAIFLA